MSKLYQAFWQYCNYVRGNTGYTSSAQDKKSAKIKQKFTSIHEKTQLSQEEITTSRA